MAEALLAVMLLLAPREPRDRLRGVAEAIARASDTVDDAALLVTISYYETRLEHRGVPFGLVSFRRQIAGQPLEFCARRALAVYRMAARCGAGVALRLGWYHSGRCEADAYSARQARTFERVRAELVARTARDGGA